MAHTHPCYACIVINLPVRSLDRLFTYRIPAELIGKLGPGSIVRVPFGKKTLAGIVVNLGHILEEGLEEHQVRPIDSLLEQKPPWSHELMELARWMQRYYGCSLLEALRCALPPGIRISVEGVKKGAKYGQFIKPGLPADALRLEAARVGSRAPRQASFLQALALEEEGFFTSDIRKDQALPLSMLKGLEAKGLITVEKRLIERTPSHSRAVIPTTSLILNREQKGAHECIIKLMDSGRGGVLLLHGITGSGKTEIYLQALGECLGRGKRGIVLIPEISLTPQALDRFRGRFGRQVALLHSGLSAGERHDEWRRIEKGEATVVLGARSALFAPVENLGLIVIDEEHESSYKQENSPRYHARHIAMKRALHHKALVILGSGTPSLESYYRAQEGKYTYIHLPNRVEGRKAPAVQIVDMRRSFNRKGDGILSPYLIKRMELALSGGGQIILLHNRRGLFNYVICTECGHILRCPACDISLRVHRDPLTLRCHYCHYSSDLPQLCPHCRGYAMDSKGVGTQKLEHSIQELFPGARTLRMDRDTTSRKGSHEEIYDTFSAGRADILLGTQMIAKGFDFPRVTLVGVILADVALSLPDFRAGERTYQLLMQVAGRTCRGDEAGEVIIQTYNPAHPAILSVARHDMQEFYQRELEERKELNYPPFLHFVRILLSGADRDLVEKKAHLFRKRLDREVMPLVKGEILGPTTPPLAYVQNTHRVHLLVKCSKMTEMMRYLEKISQEMATTHVQIIIDVDPVNFL